MGLFNHSSKRKATDPATLAFQRDLEILNDCGKLLKTTKDPNTFFSRYDLYMDKLISLADAESSKKIKVKGDSFCKQLKTVNKKKEKINLINEFIDRMWDDTCKKAKGMKTTKGKQNTYTLFFNTLHRYEKNMLPQNIKHYKSLKPDIR